MLAIASKVSEIKDSLQTPEFASFLCGSLLMAPTRRLVLEILEFIENFHNTFQEDQH
jgi:hypothetical protein